MYEELYVPLPDGQAYAQRIGMPWPLKPDLETLDRIILAHQCTVPFENLDPYDLDREPSLATQALFDKVVVQGRGGFCFELNALLCAFLQAVGYDAWPVSCRILRGKDFVPPMLHRGVVVRLEGTMYYCDVGYGGPQPAGPVPLGGERTIRGERFRGQRRTDTWWGLDRYLGEGRWEQVFEFWEEAMLPVYFVPCNFYCACSPSSTFRQRRVLNLRTLHGSLARTNTTLTVRHDGEVQTREAGSREELAAMIHDYFGIDIPAASLRWEDV